MQAITSVGMRLSEGIERLGGSLEIVHALAHVGPNFGCEI